MLFSGVTDVETSLRLSPHYITYKMLLLKNQYPIDEIETQMKKCLIYPQDKTCLIDQPDQRRKRFITLPYTSRKCEDFATRLRILVNNTFPSIDLNIAYQAPKTIGDFFPYKDKVELPEEHANVVYHLKCTKCDAD